MKYLMILIALLFTMCHTATQHELPNIVIVFTDDQGYGDLGCYGATGYRTPNLDQMASQGMKFTNFYAAQPVCSASRAGLLTGCYPNRIGISGALFPHDSIGIADAEWTMAEMLKEKGYATAIFGKWHLGHHRQFLPLQHGFDEYFGIPYSNDMWPIEVDGTRSKPDDWRSRYPDLPLIEGNETVELITGLDGQDGLTTRYTEKAVDFIRRNKGKPFFLYLPHSMPHIPLGVSDKFRGQSEQGFYGDVMMEIDWSVGELQKALRENGLEDRTIVVFTTDNGPWLKFGNHAGSSGGLREGKTTSWEGGQRVPCIVKWPQRVPKGTVCNKLASTIDFLPTFASIINAPLSGNKIDGVSLLPLLEGDLNATPREDLYYYYGKNHLNAVRKGNWKLVFPHTYRSYESTVPRNDGYAGKRVSVHLDSLELHNLMRDPGERYNVIDLYPGMVEELLVVAERARDELGDLNVGLEQGAENRAVGYLRK
jgi:arylsulfatase A-like enzyme